MGSRHESRLGYHLDRFPVERLVGEGQSLLQVEVKVDGSLGDKVHGDKSMENYSRHHRYGFGPLEIEVTGWG